MAFGRPALRVNPGGSLAPHEIVGRDAFAESMWAALEVQSILLTAERRMGKTSVLKKLKAEGRGRFVLVLRNLQDVNTPEAFVERLQDDVGHAFPRLLARPGLRERLGIRRIDAGSVGLEFTDATPVSWQQRLRLTFAALDEIDDGTVAVFLWDELPHMLAAIEERAGAESSRELLDILRATREQHACIRMVFSGSLGLHHVLKRVRPAGSAWVPTHDMRLLDLPALADADAFALATELLVNEGVDCDDVDAVGRAIVSCTSAVPFYVHLTVAGLIDRHRAGAAQATVATVEDVVSRCVADPQDPWQLMHYLHRLDAYYGARAEVVKAILDVIAIGPPPQGFDDLRNRLAARMSPPSVDELHELVELLAQDHYLSVPTLKFRLDLLLRAWRIRRRLG